MVMRVVDDTVIILVILNPDQLARRCTVNRKTKMI
jgi:hypothetical protein